MDMDDMDDMDMILHMELMEREAVRGTEGSDVLVQTTGTGVTALGGNDTITAISSGVPNNGQSFVLQQHIWAADGNDIINMGFSTAVASGNSHGHHVFGGNGSDEFNFIDTDKVSEGAIVVGRIEDYDFSRDKITVDGKEIDLTNLPSNIKIVEYNGEYYNSNAEAQQWLLIENDNGGKIFYAINAARSQEGQDEGGDVEDELHFLKHAPDFSSLKEVEYVDVYNFIPHEYYKNTNYSANELTSRHESSSSTVINGITYSEQYIHEAGGIHRAQDPNLLHGSRGDELINAQGGIDIVHGYAGNDLISGGVNSDTIYGGSGNDVIFGGSEDDSLFGGTGDDELRGNTGSDQIFGGDGNDIIDFGTGFAASGVQYGEGGAGCDTYVIVQGSMDVIIHDEPDSTVSSSFNDAISLADETHLSAVFGSNIATNEERVVQSNHDVVSFSDTELSDWAITMLDEDTIVFNSIDGEDSVTVDEYNQIESWEFAGGEQYTSDEFMAFI